MVFFFAAWAIVGTHMPPALAAAVSQDAKSDVRGHDSEDPDAPLDGVEADIGANKFGEAESRLNDLSHRSSGFLKSLLRSWLCAIQNS